MIAILTIAIFSVSVGLLIGTYLDENKKHKENSSSSELGKVIMEKDMIDSMFGNKKLDSVQESLIIKNILDNMKK